ncbi:MAG: DUF3349 domain-containing protein [Bacteroidota bacterium]|nr:DUF3349 domain-containing protein [Bacteroidota bacterium]
MDNIPPELRTTYAMLKAAFPSGLSEAEYIPVIHYLYEGMSDRQLAIVVSLLIGRKDYALTLNDIYRVQNLDVSMKVNEEVHDKLIAQGYEQWLEEE